MIQFRPYQNTAIQTARSKIASGIRRVLINAPTGSGKTVVAAGIVQFAVAKRKRVLFLAHRRELIDQTVAKLVDAGVLNFGVIMAGNRLNHAAAPVQVASIQTLIRREFPEADLIVIDEAHRAASRSYLSILANYPRAVVLGLTATPERLDGKGLDDIFDAMVVVETVPNLIEQGYLVKPVCYGGQTADLTGIKIRRGDYDESELAEAMDQPTLVGDIIANWKALARGGQTVAFATSVAHADHIAAEFRAAGVAAAMVSGETPRAQREAIIADWKAGHIQVVANALVFTEGFDYPELECCILARPTQSISMYLQQVGRIMRPAPGKGCAIILDHAGCVRLHGPPHIEREWTLEGMAAKRKKDMDAAGGCQIECDVCHLIYAAEPTLWLTETQERLRKEFVPAATTRLQGKAAERGMNTCPGCGTASCLTCTHSFVPKLGRRDIDGIAWETVASCPSCLAQYSEDVPHLITESDGPAIPETTNDMLTEIGDAIPVKVTVLNDYKRLLNVARENGRKRGWAWHQLKDKYGEAVVRDCLPRHTGEWWKAQA